MKHFYLLLFAIFFSVQIQAQNAPFITTWQVTTGNLSITIPTTGTGYNYSINFGDGSVQNNVTGDATHNYNTPGTYTVSITGNFPRFSSFNSNTINRQKLLSVEQWGDIQWESMQYSFSGHPNLVINAIDAPDLSQVTDMSYMFSYCLSFNQSIDHWDVSNITNMTLLFSNAEIFNQPLNNWNVSNVTNMVSMFDKAESFNQPLNNWNVTNVSDMSFMFRNAFNFNQNLNNWNVANVTDMHGMFWRAYGFNQPLDNWDVSNVTTMKRMFQSDSSYPSTFNQPLNNWDVSNVTDMSFMFMRAVSFNQPLNNWDVSNVSDMDEMFYKANSFNQVLNSWDVSNVINMKSMFDDATNFNQPLNNWDVSNVLSMGYMFRSATSFNQPLSNWDVSKVTQMTDMFRFASNFNQPLDNWDVSNVIYMGGMFHDAYSFNQPLNNWDVSNTLAMWGMFGNTVVFNQPLDNWDVSHATNLSGIFFNALAFNQDLSNWQINTGVLYNLLSNSGMDVHNYDTFLNHLAGLNIHNGNLGALNLEYCNLAARNYLISALGWTIVGDSLDINGCSYNTVNGNILYDLNNDGCDPNDMPADNIIISANDGTIDYSTISDSNGDYTLYLLDNTYTISLLNLPNYFTATPASSSVNFVGFNNVQVVDICLTGNQSIEDLNIILLPTSVARPGFEADYRLVVKNVGTEIIANVVATLEFDDTMQQFVSANPTPGSTTTNTLTYTIGILQPFQTFKADITMLTFQPPTVEGDDILNFIAEVTPSTNDHTPNDNIYNLAQIVVNSYDPNDKQVLQGEELHIDDVNEYLDYLIRFQNTGTASAINVRILDTLNPKLDWSTLQPISASHDYYVKIKDGNRVEFMFDNIHLPHEAANEPASHGFVAYKIKPKNNVQIGDIISGDAGIYFDFNPPIITNMVLTQIVNPLSLADNPNPLNQITVYPNPTNKTLNIFLTDNIQLEEVSIYDLQGKEVQKFQGKEKTLNVENLSRGMYFLKITTDRGVVNRKLVKE